MIELLCDKNHVIQRGSVLYLHSEMFMFDPFHDYKVDQPSEGVVLESEIISNNGNTSEGGGRSVQEHRFTFPKAGTYIIRVTKLAFDSKDDVKHEINVVVQ
jgi:hypothetical protein